MSCGMAVVMYRDWDLICSFSLSPKDLPDSPIYSSMQSWCGHVNQYITQLDWHLLSLSFKAITRVQIVLLPLKCTWMPKLLQVSLILSHCFFLYDTTMEMFLFLEPVLLELLCWSLLTACLLLILCLWLNIVSRLFRAQGWRNHNQVGIS